MISIVLYYTSILAFGFTINLFFFYLVLLGILGNNIKVILLKQISIKDFGWYNKFLFYFIILYLFLVVIVDKGYINNIIYLDNSLPSIVNCELDGVSINVSGDYLDKLFTHIGSASAFAIGARLAAAFVVKHPMSLTGKIGTSIGGGAISSASFQMVNLTAGIIRGTITRKELENSTVSIEIKDVNISNGAGEQTETVSNLSQNVDNLDLLRATIFPSPAGVWKFKFNLDPSSINTTETKKFNVIEMIENNRDKNLTEIFAQDDNTRTILSDININSPLESNILHDNLNTILTYNLPINLFMVYLVFMLLFIFTVKFVLDSEAFLNKVKTLPLGKYLYFILNKLINAWKYSSIFWIYLILFFLLIFSASSSYAIYGCLFILNN